MKLKYYLRGLGIGILVTALILGLVTKDKSNMTDEEIKARAHELGMVEQRTLADVAATPIPDTALDKEEVTPEATKEPPLTPAPTEEPEITPEPSKEPETTPEPSREPEITPAPTQEPGITPTPDSSNHTGATETEGPVKTEAPPLETEEIELAIVRGDSSYSVSKRLAELGLIDDAREYDTYLCENGYDKKLNVGTYKLIKGQSWEEIAKIISRTR